MFCCVSTPTFEESDPLIVDLNKILADKAWKAYQSTFTSCQKMRLKRDKFNIEVPENFFVCQQIGRPEITPRSRSTDIIAPDAPKSSATEVVANNNSRGNDTAGLLKGKVPTARELTNPEVVTVDTEFSNDTAERQLYKFRFEKTRSTEIEVSVQKGFSMGGKTSFSIGLPSIFGDSGLGVETEMSLEVTRSEGQRFEESMVMEATSDIAVGPNSRYTANVQLEERQLNADFRVITRMSMPQKRAPVYIKRKNDDVQVFVYTVKDLTDVFDSEKVPCAQEVKEDGKIVFHEIDFVTEGVMKGSLACNHKINLKSDESDELKKRAQERYHQQQREDVDES